MTKQKNEPLKQQQSVSVENKIKQLEWIETYLKLLTLDD